MLQDANALEHQVLQNSDYIEKLSKIVIGNGEIGMDEEVRNLTKSNQRIEDLLIEHVDKHKEKEKRQLSKKDKIQIGVIVGLVLNATTVIFAILYLYFQTLI